jgi:hypothetical protein
VSGNRLRSLKSGVAAADTSHMPIFVTMAYSHESDQPGGPEGDDPSPGDQLTPDDAPGLTPERLRQLITRLESGCYDTPEVRDQIARRVRKELDS